MLRALFTGFAIVALAASAAAAPGGKPKARKAPSAIEIVNQRQDTLTAFTLATPGDKGKVVAKLAKPLPAGGKIKLKVSRAKGCDYVARWQFEDAGDEASVDLCNDPKIVLTD